MFKRLLAIIAITAALAACSPSTDSSTEPSAGAPSDAVPSESIEASPSAS
jgi:nitrous oxide reductase accessory protein NosL